MKSAESRMLRRHMKLSSEFLKVSAS